MIIRTNGTQKESTMVDIIPKNSTYLSYDIDYDTTKPEDTIRFFVNDIKGMITKYEANTVRLGEIENELQDIYHYIEMAPYKKAPDGNKLYRIVKELRCERRICKNENDLLQPIYEYFHATEVLNRLTHVQGECSKVKETIDARRYQVRTDILKKWLDPEPEVKVSVIKADDTEDTEWLKEIPSIEEDVSNEPIIEPFNNKANKQPKYKQVWKAAN